MANLELFDNYVVPHNAQRQNILGWAKSVVLLSLGIFFIYSIISGNLSNYINQRFAWLSYVAAGLFLLLGMANAVDLLRHRDDKNEVHQIFVPGKDDAALAPTDSEHDFLDEMSPRMREGDAAIRRR